MPSSESVSRRTFLEKLFAATIVGATTPVLLLGTTFPTIRVGKESISGLYELNLGDFFPLQNIGGSVRFIISEVGPTFRVIVTRTTEDHFEAVNAKCPHEGNRVRAANSEGLLICEAHESTFQPDGTYIEGPATDDFGNGLNLKRYETAFDGEGTVTIEIDELSSVSSRESGEEFIALHSTGPLPSSSVFRYRLVGAGHATLSIWSLDGRELLRPLDEWVASGEGHISVDLSSLARGLYLYRFHVSGRPVGTGRVVVPQ